MLERIQENEAVAHPDAEGPWPDAASGPFASLQAAQPAPDHPTMPRLARTDLNEQIESAEALIKYAADAGIVIEPHVRRDVLAAKNAAHHGLAEDHAEELLAALTVLSIKLHPVTGNSLRKCEVQREASKTLWLFRGVAFGLAFIIVPFSVAAFIATAMCEAIRVDIEAANAVAVTLVHELSQRTAHGDAGQPVPLDKARLEDLQRLAATTRDIDRRMRSLRLFATGQHDAPYEWNELEVPVTDFSQQTIQAIESYQLARYFAQRVQEDVSLLFGALTSCLLPALYALLGACAYLIRMFEKEVKARSFTGREKTAARFIIAGIGGLVVGLFGNFGTGHGTALPPLAIAFLVGYGVDVFFYFLDGLLQTFGRSRPGSGSDGRASETQVPRAHASVK